MHEECLARHCESTNSVTCPACKHAVVPEKWARNSGAGAKLVAFLRKHPWGAKLVAEPVAVPLLAPVA